MKKFFILAFLALPFTMNAMQYVKFFSDKFIVPYRTDSRIITFVNQTMDRDDVRVKINHNKNDLAYAVKKRNENPIVGMHGNFADSIIKERPYVTSKEFEKKIIEESKKPMKKRRFHDILRNTAHIYEVGGVILHEKSHIVHDDLEKWEEMRQLVIKGDLSVGDFYNLVQRCELRADYEAIRDSFKINKEYAHAMLNFFEKLSIIRVANGSAAKHPDLFSTHPPLEERKTRVAQQIKELDVQKMGPGNYEKNDKYAKSNDIKLIEKGLS